MDEKSQRGRAYIGRDDASTLAGSEMTFSNNPDRYSLSHNGGEHELYEEEDFVVITGFDQDHTKADKMTFFGFAPMRYRLHDKALDFLLEHRRWADATDSEYTVGKKNVIVCFVGLATIEDCLVCEDDERLLPTVASFAALMDTLGILQRRGPQAHTFMKAIQRAFTRSRIQEIQECLRKGHESPPVPEHPLDKMLLDVVDRHITFLFTKKPLSRLAVKFPLDKTLKLRCSVLRSLLDTKAGINKCWSVFVPTIPAAQQATWPWPWKVTAWRAEQAKLVGHSGSAQSNQAREKAGPSTIPSQTSPSQHIPSHSESKTPQPTSPMTTPKPLQDKILDFQTAFNVVKTSFEELRHHIRSGNVSGPETSKVKQRIDERSANFRDRMNRVITKTSNGGVTPIVQDREPLHSVDMSTAFRNLDRGLLSIMTAAEKGELSVEECVEAVEDIVEYFKAAY